MRQLRLPLDESEVRSLHAGENVLLSGRMFTARDAAHSYLVSHEELEAPYPALNGGVLYHCGPVMVRDEASGEWRVTAAGPTTSSREEPYESTVIRRFGIRAIIGKGGMGAETARACQECGCVYLQATGGAAQVLASAVKRVTNVYYYEQFGAPEAIWELEVTDFPATVTMDTHGRSLHAEVLSASRKRLQELLG